MGRTNQAIASICDAARQEHESITERYRAGEIDALEEAWLRDKVTAFKIERELTGPTMIVPERWHEA
jgi:hypothetical protein